MAKARFGLCGIDYGVCDVQASAGSEFDIFKWRVVLPDGRTFSASDEELEFLDA